MGDIATIPTAPSADFLVLGALEARVDGRPVELGAALERRLLAAAVSSHPFPVPRSRLIQAVWDTEQPQDPIDAFDHLAMRLRRRLEAAGLRGVLRAEPGGYRLGVPGAQVDANRFRELVAEADKRSGGDLEDVAELLETALSLSRGRPLDGLDGRWVDNYRHVLEEEQHAAELSFNEVAIRLGRHRRQIARLQALLQERPDDEYLAWLAMHAYYRSGRQIDAQETFHRLRQELDDRVATESHRALGDLYQRMISGDPRLMEPTALDFPVGRPVPRVVAASSDPRQDSGNSDETSDGDTASSGSYTQANIGRKVVSRQGGDGEFRFVEADQYVEISRSRLDNLKIGNFYDGPKSGADHG